MTSDKKQLFPHHHLWLHFKHSKGLRMGNLNISALLLSAMAAMHCGISENTDFIEGNCNDDVIKLPCKATEQTTKYRYIMWYKGANTAIIKKKNQEYTHYFNSTYFSLGEKETLKIHNVQPSDSGEYKCYLAAAVGGQNGHSIIRLNVSECLNESTVPSVTVDSCPVVEELTVHWAVLGLSLFSMAKIILCIVTVGVCDHVIFSTVRRKQEIRGSKTGTSSSWKD